MIRPPKPRHGGRALLIFSASVLSLFFLIFSDGFLAESKVFASASVPVSFSDLPSNSLYYPAIEVFQQQNIIIGDTLGGEPTGRLRPKDYLMRAEFTKVATMVHLLEEKQTEGKLSEYMDISLNDFIFKTDYLLRPYYSSVPPAPKFTDVPDKDPTCAKDPGGCEPWYTQYVNYMASLGTIKGTGNNMFSSNDTLLRIHALKMVMAKSGTVPAEQDSRFKRIASDSRIQNREVRCLNGAEDYILESNGGAHLQDAQNLLAYALLADKLDIFGNECQFFAEKSANTPSARAELLQNPLTRQEVARFFALTTTIPELQLDLVTDSTVDSKEQYIAPVDMEVKEEENALDKLKGKKNIGEKPPNPQTPTIDNAGNNENSGEILTGGPLPYPNEGVDDCGPIPTDRANSREVILGCIATLRRNQVSEDEIDRLLKKFGLWDLVADVRGNSPIDESPVVQDDSERDTSNLVACSVLSPACWVGMKNKVEAIKDITKGEATLSDYKTIGISETAIKKARPELPEGLGIAFWYTVIPGWQTVSDGLWGGVFSKKQYSKAHLIDTLFPQKSGDNYKELIVKVLGRADPYDGSDANASANKKAMIKNYRTDRWYKIYYINPAKPEEGEKTGWVPVSSLIWKNENLFSVTDSKGFYEFRNNTVYEKYSSGVLVCSGGVDRGDSVIDKLILHNTAGSGVSGPGSGCAVHYYLARNHNTYGDKFVIRVPEYQTTETASSTLAEQRAIDVEMVNWEWANPAKDFSDYRKRMVEDGGFNNFYFDKVKGDYNPEKPENSNHYVEIKGEDYELVKYYFSEKDGFFEVFNISDTNLPKEGIELKKQVREDKKVFERFYKQKDGQFVLWSKDENGFNPQTNIDAKKLIDTDADPRNQLQSLYGVLNKISFDYQFFVYPVQATAVDFSRVMNATGTYPLNTYQLPEAPKDQALTDGEVSDYYEKYTIEQYDNLQTFIRHMNEKYGIPSKTFNGQVLGSIPKKYGFYYQKKGSYEIPNQVVDFKGIISHRNSKYGGKMCPAPGFQIDRIPVLMNQ